MKYLYNFIFVLFVVFGVASCGGDDSDTPSLESNALFKGTLTDQETGDAIKDIEVGVQSGNDIYKTTTDDNGYYELYVPDAGLQYVPQVVLEFSSADYRYKHVYYTSVVNGSTYSLDTETAKIEKHPENVLRFDDMTSIGKLYHLGDDNYSGSANSQLQVASSGRFSLRDFSLTKEQVDKYDRINVTFHARGVQRPNKIYVYDSVKKKAILKTKFLSDSDVNGLFTRYTIVFSTNDLLAAEYNYQFVMQTVTIDGAISGGDLDDIEIVNFYATLLER